MGEAKRRQTLAQLASNSGKINQVNKPTARKVLVIGGSSFNEGTPQKIAQALTAPEINFLNEWAVIIAIHQYLSLQDKKGNLDKFKTQITSDFSLVNPSKIYFITKPSEIIVFPGNIYVLPHPLPNPLCYFDKSVDLKTKKPIKKFKTRKIENYMQTSIIDDNEQIKIHTKYLANFGEFQNLFLNDEFDKSGIKRITTAHDFLSLDTKDLPYGVENSDKELVKSLPHETLLYHDMPCIDKIMSEVAASKNLDKIAALLLCGLHGDGAMGLQRIKENGGCTAVQLPGECFKEKLGNATASMPKTALDIEPSHQIVTLEDKPNEDAPRHLKLSEWLYTIK
ncbi:chemotaxis protein CheB [Trichormus sp. NMC-1]|uniref:chemotaxis protein CheB n=1 Tax=Trichormus sp. NMC-1 TaxID=1853259 RepID=UPI0008DC035C|nr:chemotaxis protein CheB [Trichormus sp. NMC-1]